MKIASVTLAGNNADIIGDALRSVVDEVDLCVLVLTSPVIADGTEDVARLVAGDKLRVWRKPWRDDFAYMRNAAMEMAAKSGATWGVWLDTDERIVCAPGALRHVVALADVGPVDCVTAWHVSLEYSKERILRLPLRGQYRGLTHEYWDPADPEDRRTVPSEQAVRFDELAKDADRMRAKAERDLALLEQQAARQPEEPRWLFYQGNTLELLGRTGEAVDAFVACVNASLGWSELRGWAAFRAFDLIVHNLADLPEDEQRAGYLAAASLVAQGSILCPYPELDWALAYCCLKLEEYDAAVLHANKAISGGKTDPKGWGQGTQRTGHVFPAALYEAPYAIHVEALEGLRQRMVARNDPRAAECALAVAIAQRKFQEALAMREAA